MSIDKFGYSVESLQNDKIENLENRKEFESQSKRINIKLNDVSDKLETYINEIKEQNTELRTDLRTEGAVRVEEIQFNNGETNLILDAKLFLDINKSIEDEKTNLKDLEQDIENNLFEKKKEIILDAAKLVEEQQNIFRTQSERNLIVELEKSKIQGVKDVIQLLYNKGLFDSSEKKD